MSARTSPVPAPASTSTPAPAPATMAVSVPLQTQTADTAVGAEQAAQQRKSYRRKYRKIMVKFEERMRESNGLFRDEQRIYDISRRLAEQTDQLLQMLLELNDRPQIPSQMRYDLRTPAEIRESIRPTRQQDQHSAHEQLRVARNRVQKGEMTTTEYGHLQKDLLQTVQFVPTKSYATLVNKADLTNLTQPSTDPKSPPVSVLTIRQEQQYLQSLDDFLDGKTNVARSHTSRSLGSRTAEKSADREREMQLKNPVSVYNWLRKHQPQVFLQDHEAGSGDKSGKSAGSRSSKRAAQKEVKQEQEYYDDDGIAMERTSSAKGKRKRDEDSAFRPKGGRSGHPAKRRKEEVSGKRSKRSSMDARNM